MGFFLHIPFPAPEVFTALPQHQRLARGLCAFDLVGFQTERDTANFRRYLIEICGGTVLDDGAVRVFDRTLRAETFSIGIDPDEIAELAERRGRPRRRRAARPDHRQPRAGASASTGWTIPRACRSAWQAFGRMLDDHEDLHGHVSFLQIAPPSREAVDAYQVLREELDRLAGRINADYADLDWMPIRYLARSYSRGALAGLYRLSRVGLVTPLHDGMNLVAKEFVAAQDPDDPGALVLSEFAGAAEQLKAAILVNPHDIAGTADAIFRALSMPLEERRERWQAMIESVREHDIAWWRHAFLDALEATPGACMTLGDLAGLHLAPAIRSSSTSTARWPRSAPTPTRSRCPPPPPKRWRRSRPASAAPSRCSAAATSATSRAAPRTRSGAPAATASRSCRPARRLPPPPAPLARRGARPAARRRPHPRRPARAEGPGRRPPLPRGARGRSRLPRRRRGRGRRRARPRAPGRQDGGGGEARRARTRAAPCAASPPRRPSPAAAR